jgi:hypothetical protein
MFIYDVISTKTKKKEANGFINKYIHRNKDT